MAQPFIQFDGITKRFGGVLALDHVSLSIAAGEVHGLMGENGAGKSTLGKTLAGIHVPDEGRILLNGQPQAFRSPADALAAGIGMVHQELAFCPDLSVAENLCMGRYPRRFGLLNRRRMNEQAEVLLARIGG
ncbi:MAG: ATP-binding cassette domain-containing protein [Tepidisphaeraceae bacterium]